MNAQTNAVISPESFEQIADDVANGAVVTVTEVTVISVEEFEEMFPDEWVADNPTYNEWKAANLAGFRQDEHEDYVHMMEMKARHGDEMIAEQLTDVTTEWSI